MEKLSDLKESHLMQTAEFDVAQGIDYEPAFNWWVKHMLKKRDRIVANIRNWKTRFVIKSHTCGIELPNTVKQALACNAKNGNTYGQMQYPKKCRMSECHSRFYQMEGQYP